MGRHQRNGATFAWRGWRLALAFILVACALAARAEPPRRIISMSPNLTQTLFDLGVGDRMVGVSDFCLGPPAALKLPKVGGWSNPNLERLTELRPDLIVVLGRQQAVQDFGNLRGVHVEPIEMMSLATIRSGIETLGRLTGREDAASSLTARLDRRVEDFRRAAAERKGPKPRVFISMTRREGQIATLFTVGGGTFLDEAVELAGGVNVYHDVKQPFPQVATESLVARRPDVILELEAGKKLDDAQRQALRDDWKPLAMLPAVAEGRIAVMTDDDLLVAGPNFPSLVERLEKAIRGKSGEVPAVNATESTEAK